MRTARYEQHSVGVERSRWMFTELALVPTTGFDVASIKYGASSAMRMRDSRSLQMRLKPPICSKVRSPRSDEEVDLPAVTPPLIGATASWRLAAARLTEWTDAINNAHSFTSTPTWFPEGSGAGLFVRLKKAT